MKLWDVNSKQRLLCFGVGLGTGLLVLLLPPKIETQVQKEYITQEKIITKDVVRYKTAWKDRVVTIEKPGGERVVIVEKSGSNTDTSTKVVNNSKVVKKTENTTIFDTRRYSVGVEYLPLNQRFSLTGAVRLGNLPLWATGTVGDIPVTVLPINLRFGIGVRLEF